MRKRFKKAIDKSCAMYTIARKFMWLFRWQLCCSAFFFLFACIYGLGRWMQPAEISIEFASPDNTVCNLKTATHLYRYKNGQSASTITIEGNETKRGTSLWIRYLWLENTEKDKALAIKSVAINGEVLSSKWILDHLDTPNYTAQIDHNEILTFTGQLRLKTDELQTNKTVTRRFALIVFACILATLVFLFATIVISKISSWRRKFSDPVLVGIQLICFLFILAKIAYEHWNHPYWFTGDTAANLINVTSFVVGEGYLFDPFITAGTGYLIPLGLLLKMYPTYSLSIITNCIFVVNYAILLLPAVIFFIFSPYKFKDRITFSFLFVTTWLLLPSIYGKIDFLPQLFGEMSTSAMCLAGCFLFVYGKKHFSVFCSGMLFAWTCNIKSTGEILLACLILVAIVRIISEKDTLFSWKRILVCSLGYIFIQICVISFQIYSLGGWSQYLVFREQYAAYNLEHGIRLSLWNQDFLYNTVKDNYNYFLTYAGGLALFLLIAGFIFSLHIIFKVTPQCNTGRGCG